MKLPAGTDGGTITNPRVKGFSGNLLAFRGAIEIETREGFGFIIAEKGTILAAYFTRGEDSMRGRDALLYLLTNPAQNDVKQIFCLRTYSEDEFTRALTIAREEKLLVSGFFNGAGMSFAGSALPVLLDADSLEKIARLQGVIAVLIFFEGFPVQFLGDADFEHVAAGAEDLIRAGAMMALEMKGGKFDQLILETTRNKVIIVPFGDLFLCVFTTSEAPVGLIRVVVKSIIAGMDV